jgi:hypothetical protein
VQVAKRTGVSEVLELSELLNATGMAQAGFPFRALRVRWRRRADHS